MVRRLLRQRLLTLVLNNIIVVNHAKCIKGAGWTINIKGQGANTI